MAYNPIVAGDVASSAYMNAALQAAVIRVADATALEATLTHSNPPATGAWLLQDDTEVIKKRSGSAFTDVLDLRRTRGLAAPDLDFVTSAGAALGTIRASAPLSGQTQWDFLSTAGVGYGKILGASGILSLRSSSNATALTLSNLSPSFTSTGTINIGGSNINLQTQTLDISQQAPNLTLTPSLELGGTAVGANKYLGTDASGRLAALDGGVGGGGTFIGLTDTPAAFGSVGQGLRVAAGGTALEFFNLTSGGATTFLALTDTPSAFTDQGGKHIAVNTAANALEFVDALTLGPNSVTAAEAQLDTMEHRQEWHNRLALPTHDTVGIQDFTVFSGVPTSGGLVGFASTQAGTINGNTHSASFRVNDNLYSVTQIAQVTSAGTNLNNIIIRIGPDPETNNDVNADWFFQVGGVFLSFADATKTTVPGNRVIFTWTGSPRLFIGGQTTICRIRQPLADIHSNFPTNFSGIQGTVAPEQFRDGSIVPSRLSAGTPELQAQLRTKAGFAALSSNTGQPLFYVGNQIVQQGLDITSLNNFGPNAEPSVGVTPLLMKWGPTGLQTIQRLDLADFPQPPGIAAGYIPKWDGTAWIVAAETGGTGSAFSWATAGRMPNFNSLPGFTSGNRKVIIGTTTNNAYEFRQPQFSDIAGTVAANQFAAASISGDKVGLDTLTAGNINVTDLAAWQTKLGIPASSTATVATWARAGNTDLIPDDKLDPFVYHSFSKLETMTLTVGHFTGARGFDRISGGGGSLTNATFHLPGSAGNVQVIAIDQLPSASVGGTSEITISLVGVLPLDFNQFYLVFERSGFAKVLRFEDATMRTPPTDTNYPAGLQNYTSYTWAAQPDNILYRQAANSTTNVFIAAPFDIAIEQYLLLPELPTTSGFKFLVGNNGGLRYRDVDLTAAEEADFTLEEVHQTRADQTAYQIQLGGSGSVDFFTRSGAVLTARKSGLAFVTVSLDAGINQEDRLVEVWGTINNQPFGRSYRTYSHYRERLSWTFAYNFNANDTVRFFYKALDVPASASNAPAIPAFAVPSYSASNNETTVTITSPSTSLYDYVEYSRRIHGAGTTDWEPWTRILGDSTTLYIPDVNKERTDIRVRIVNSSGVGRYRQWVAGASATTTEASAGFGQTINFSGNLHISRQAISVA